MADDDRSRLHQIVDALADDELPIARQLLELLARGLAVPRASVAASDNGHDDGDADDDADDPMSSPAVVAKLAELTDDELLRLDQMLETDREAAKQFWRDRFGEELEDDERGADGVR